MAPRGRSISVPESGILAGGDSLVENVVILSIFCCYVPAISEHLNIYISPQLSLNFGFPSLQFNKDIARYILEAFSILTVSPDSCIQLQS